MHRLVGHAIVSADDRIADVAGRMPDALRNDADWALFQAALDRAAITLIGRRSHEATPNLKKRLRLIVSGSARGLERRYSGYWLNPYEMSVQEALQTVLPHGGEVAVVGGQQVFDLVFMKVGFDEFHLARARRVLLPNGRGLFKATEERGVPAHTMLASAGMIEGEERVLDADADVTLTIWRRPT